MCLMLPEKCLEWVDEKVRSKAFLSRSHAVESLLLQAMKPRPVSLTVESERALRLHKKEKKEKLK